MLYDRREVIRIDCHSNSLSRLLPAVFRRVRLTHTPAPEFRCLPGSSTYAPRGGTSNRGDRSPPCVGRFKGEDCKGEGESKLPLLNCAFADFCRNTKVSPRREASPLGCDKNHLNNTLTAQLAAKNPATSPQRAAGTA